MSSNTSTGPSTAKKSEFSGIFKWFTSNKSTEIVSTRLLLNTAQSTSTKLSLQQMFRDGKVPGDLKDMTLSELVKYGRVALDGEGNITIMYNATAKSCYGEAVSCYKKSIDGMKRRTKALHGGHGSLNYDYVCGIYCARFGSS